MSTQMDHYMEQCERLEKALAKAEAERDASRELATDAIAGCDQARAQRDAAREALRKYGKHFYSCKPAAGPECSCGYSHALKDR